MSLRTVCRVCLATDAPVHNIVDSPLRGVYEKLTDISLTRPAVACYLCFSQLRKCHNLMVKSVRADKVLVQILQSGQLVKGESVDMLNHEAYRHALSITPIALISITTTENNLMDEQVKQEPLSPQCVEEREMDKPACDEHLKFEESEDERGVQTTLLEDLDIESLELKDEGDMEQEELDPLNISVSLEDMETEEIAVGGNMKSARTDYMKRKESKGAAPAKKYTNTAADKTQDRSTLTSHGKNILEKQRTVIEEEITSRNVGSYMLRSTKKSSNNRQITINTSMYCDTVINKSNVCINSDNDCAGTNTDVDNSSSKQLKMFICNYCSNMFDDKYLLILHIKLHNTVKMETNKKRINQHTKLRKTKHNRVRSVIRRTETHSGQNTFECEICLRRFTLKGDLNRHIRIHTGEKPYECEICKVRFNRNGTLKSHLRVHTGEKPYECEKCKVRFSENSSLKRHLRLHGGEKLYVCKICKIRFKRKDGLNRHLRVHTGEKPYECEICKLSFNESSSLKKHLILHTGEKPYKCDICRWRFTRKHNLSKHLRIHAR